jgi:hypothetical protein
MYEYFGEILDEPEAGITSKPLNSYLAESLNVELINIILQGITNFSEPSWKVIKNKKNKELGNPVDHDLRVHELGEFKVRQLNLDRIQIQDPKEWDGAKADFSSVHHLDQIRYSDK